MVKINYKSLSLIRRELKVKGMEVCITNLLIKSLSDEDMKLLLQYLKMGFSTELIEEFIASQFSAEDLMTVHDYLNGLNNPPFRSIQPMVS